MFFFSSPIYRQLGIATTPTHGLKTANVPLPYLFTRMFKGPLLTKLTLWFMISMCTFDFYVYHLPAAQVNELFIISTLLWLPKQKKFIKTKGAIIILRCF